MILTFSQGVVTYSTDTGTPTGTQNFLVAVATNSKVDLHAPIEQMFQLAFAHRDTNYLLTLRQSGDINAWGYGTAANNNAPFTEGGGSGPSSNDYYLYVDLDRSTGLTSYGWTKYAPDPGTVASTAASIRPTGYHWYDTANKIMKEWTFSGIPPTYGAFAEKIRCFVAKYTFGGGFTSLSINTPSFVGTTVGLPTASYRVGALVFDHDGSVLKRTLASNATTFFTTEDLFYTGLQSTARSRVETIVLDGIAQQPIAAYQAVYFSGLHQVLPLTVAVQDSSIVGILEQEAGVSGELVQVTTSGVVNNPNWAWTTVNELIYVDKDQPGVLTSEEADGYSPDPGQKPIAVAIDETTILLRPSELILSVAAGQTFISLSDTPADYASSGSKILRVTTGASGVEFGAYLPNLEDVDSALAPSAGHVLYFSGASTTWKSAAPGSTSGVEAWNIHLDQIAALSAATNQFIVGSAGAFTAKTPTEVKTILNYVLNDMADVTTTGSPALAVGDVLRYNGSIWEPSPDAVYLQEVFKTVAADTGAVTAATASDTLTITGGRNITTRTQGSPVGVVTDWAANLGDLSDVDLVGSPLPVDGQVLTKVGNTWQAQSVPTPSVPTFELPRPYDFAAQSFADVGSDSIMFKYVAPRDFVLFSYGHQAQSRTRPPTVDRDFAVTLDDGTTEQRIGTFRFYQSAISRNETAFDMGLGTALTEGVPAGSPTHTAEPLWNVSRGNIIRIYTPVVGSPPGLIAGFDDVSITLRGAVGPNVPTGTISANFIGASAGSPPYIGSPVGATIPSSLNLNVVGDYTYIEYSCLATSSDGSTWWPLDANEHSDTNRGIQLSEDGITYTTLNSESDYFTSALTDLHLQFLSISPSRYYKVQATVFSIAGITTATGVIYIPAF